LIEQHVGADGAEVLGVHDVRVTLGPEAELEAICWSDLPDTVSLLRREILSVGADAVYKITQAHFGGRLQRFESAVDLAGSNATFNARGVFALRGRQHVDVHLDVRHNARDTTSDVLWRGVADQRARGILHGAITVAPGSDGADARLQTKNLLLSPHAEIDAQPVLEIYADEVKAAHGATVGQLDESALFYFRSRGLPAATARSLLIAGFCREAFDGIADADLRGRLDALLVERLPQTVEAAA
jgi:Fe-S cluster assembly protein SufD